MSKSSARAVGRRSVRLGAQTAPVPPKRTSTKILLLDAAERLFAQYGLEGVSLREIALAAGQANTNVVQYHFKDKAGLITAILDDRVGKMEELRRAMLGTLDRKQLNSTRELLRVMWAPLLVTKPSDAGHVFCRFFLQYLLHSEMARHPVFKSLGYTAYQMAKSRGNAGAVYRGAEQMFPSIVRVARLLRGKLKAIPEEVYSRRLSSLTLMFVATVAEHDYAHLHGSSRASGESTFDIEPILDMAAAALAAPIPRKNAVRHLS